MVPSCTRPPSPALHFFFLHCPPDHRDLHSFPTRRSSDLLRSEFEMLLAALIIFAVAAVGGIVLASFVLRGRFAPWLVGGLHALIAALGLVILVLALLDHHTDATRLYVSFGLLLSAA